MDLRKNATIALLMAGATSLLFAFNNCAPKDAGFVSGQSDLGSAGCKVEPEVLVQQIKDGDYHINIFSPESEVHDFNEKLYLNNQGDPARAPKYANGQVNWYYNPANAPSALASTALETIQSSMAYWSSVCNIKFNYMGTTTRGSNENSGDRTNVVGWGDASGSTGITFSYMSSSRTAGNVIAESDVEFNSAQVRNTTTLRAVANHELGHVLGLAHSNVSESIMFANPYHDIQYLLMLRPDDVAGCVGLYGPAGTATAPSPTPAPSATPAPSPSPAVTPRPSVTPAPVATPAPTVAPGSPAQGC